MTAATRFGKPLPAAGTIGVAAAASRTTAGPTSSSRSGSGSLGVPAVYGLPLGHTKHLAALPLGVTCTLDAGAKTLTVDEPALREPPAPPPHGG